MVSMRVFTPSKVPPALPHDLELCLFRIAQEALNNVVKHSGTREVQVTLRRTESGLVLRITDFGRGFDQGKAAAQDGLGLASMRERLRLVDGELTVDSRLGQGTTIIARVRLPNAEAEGKAADTVRVA